MGVGFAVIWDGIVEETQMDCYFAGMRNGGKVKEKEDMVDEKLGFSRRERGRG